MSSNRQIEILQHHKTYNTLVRLPHTHASIPTHNVVHIFVADEIHKAEITPELRVLAGPYTPTMIIGAYDGIINIRPGSGVLVTLNVVITPKIVAFCILSSARVLKKILAPLDIFPLYP